MRINFEDMTALSGVAEEAVATKGDIARRLREAGSPVYWAMIDGAIERAKWALHNGRWPQLGECDDGVGRKNLRQLRALRAMS